MGFAVLPKARHQFNRTTLITVALTAFLAGLALCRLGLRIDLATVSILALVCIAVLRKRGWPAICGVVIFGIGLGLLRGGYVMEQLHPYTQIYGQKVVMSVTAMEDATYGKNGQLTFDAKGIQLIKPTGSELPGRIKVSGFGENMIYRGDIVEVEGKLSKVRGGRQGQVSFATLQIRAHTQGLVDDTRREFAAGMQSAVPEPAASFGLGLLIGQRSTLPKEVGDHLAVAGLTHLIAVSGYNLTIIVNAVRRLTARFSKYQSTVIALSLVGLFLLTTGMSASIVRASIISGLTIWAWYYGRTIKPLLLIALAAALTAGWNPLYLWGDLGWYLSFLAFFGVLVIAPLLVKRFYSEKQPRFLQAILIETICAQIMTLPLILFIFQQVSLISIAANVLIVPMVPLAMLCSVVAGAAGMFVPAVAGWFAWPASVVLTYMLDVANLLSKVPHALAQYTLPLYGLIFLYAVLMAMTAILWRKTREKYGIITDKKPVSERSVG